MSNVEKFLSDLESKKAASSYYDDEDPDVYADQFKLIELVKEQRASLKHIANGCLVPPDGGSPTWQDAIDEARTALQKCEDLCK